MPTAVADREAKAEEASGCEWRARRRSKDDDTCETKVIRIDFEAVKECQTCHLGPDWGSLPTLTVNRIASFVLGKDIFIKVVWTSVLMQKRESH